ncbi:MAG: pantoate--beta-alanine ligase [Chitinivibrionales bacterium]|nr:pantoate--beta-alanine ligase [Chitinivibrionales bacterium]
MEIIRNPHHMQQHAAGLKADGVAIGFAPTMGALHQGHLALLDMLKGKCDLRVMSIFVNPAQFGPQEDYDAYPRQFERDCGMAQAGGCDVLFAPDRESMYPRPFYTDVTVATITEGLCGAARPGHFAGVATVVAKLFNIVMPRVAVFGQKDAQQAIVIKRMVTDLHFPVTLLIAPIVREADGLAMSSRNAYLSDRERAEVALINQGLQRAATLFEHGERTARALISAMHEVYAGARIFTVEYSEIVDTIHVQPVDQLEGPALIAVACRTNETNTRLIDNCLIGGEI